MQIAYLLLQNIVSGLQNTLLKIKHEEPWRTFNINGTFAVHSGE